MTGVWVLLGLIWIGLCVDRGLCSIARAVQSHGNAK